MTAGCTHRSTIAEVTPSAAGCEECLKSGDWWVHLRLCRTCGHVGCCDDSPNTHATKHFHATAHPIIEGYDPPEGWGWCYVDEVAVALPSKTPHPGPDPPLRLTHRPLPLLSRDDPSTLASTEEVRTTALVQLVVRRRPLTLP